VTTARISGDLVVLILALLSGLFVALLFSCWSCARSYFEKGRLRGVEETTREIARGVELHYTRENLSVPEDITKAIEGVRTIADTKSTVGSHQARLWLLGDAIGRACWQKGYIAAVGELSPEEGKVRLDFSMNELSQLSWLAHLGFQHMMPNYRDFEIHRFKGEDEACEGARAVSRLEVAIQAKHKLLDDPGPRSKSRRLSIREWWSPAAECSTA
jgi:hypothetical protein